MAHNQRATLSDVAREAGVCRQIAGSVLNGAHGNNNSRASLTTQERIRRVAKQLNYKPNMAAMLLRGRRAHLYGLLVASAGDPLRAMLVQQIDTQAAKHGCHMLIGNTTTDDMYNVTGRYIDQIDEFSRRGVDGMIYLVHDWAKTNVQHLLDIHPKTVFYDYSGKINAPCVMPDRAAAVRQSLEYLLQRGHRRIGLATLSKSHPSHVERVEAYHEASASLGFPVDPKMIFIAEDHGLSFDTSGSDTSLNMPAELTDRVIDFLVRDGGADAVICHDDFLAADMLRRLRARNLSVPNDVAIVGYLSHSLSLFTDPPLTTFDPNYELAAHHIVSMLEKMINDPNHQPEPHRVRIKPILFERPSA